jgi:hypothetical protein
MKRFLYSIGDWIYDNTVLVELGLAFLIIIFISIDISLRLPLNDEILSRLEKILTPAITLIGFILVIITLSEVNRSNNNKASSYYYETIDKEINEFLAKVELVHFGSAKEFYKSDNEEHYKVRFVMAILTRLISTLESDENYKTDFNRIESGEVDIKSVFFLNQSYLQLVQVTYHVYLQLQQQVYTPANFLIQRIQKEKRLSTYHQDLLIDKLYTNILINGISIFFDEDLTKIRIVTVWSRPEIKYLFDKQFMFILKTALGYPRYNRIIESHHEIKITLKLIREILKNRTDLNLIISYLKNR